MEDLSLLVSLGSRFAVLCFLCEANSFAVAGDFVDGFVSVVRTLLDLDLSTLRLTFPGLTQSLEPILLQNLPV